MFVPYIARLAKTTNTCTELYHSFIQYSDSYMFRQWFAIIRELLGFIEWVIYHIMYVYVVCVPECCGSVCCASQMSAFVGVTRILIYPNTRNEQYENHKAVSNSTPPPGSFCSTHT
jgi:hypothetical protein